MLGWPSLQPGRGNLLSVASSWHQFAHGWKVFQGFKQASKSNSSSTWQSTSPPLVGVPEYIWKLSWELVWDSELLSMDSVLGWRPGCQRCLWTSFIQWSQAMMCFSIVDLLLSSSRDTFRYLSPSRQALYTSTPSNQLPDYFLSIPKWFISFLLYFAISLTLVLISSSSTVLAVVQNWALSLQER